MSGVHKYPTISFRISPPREREEIEAKILASGLSIVNDVNSFCLTLGKRA